MTAGESSVIAEVLIMRANYIETDDPCTSAVDAEMMGKSFKELDPGQMEYIVKLRKLAKRFVRWRGGLPLEDRIREDPDLS